MENELIFAKAACYLKEITLGISINFCKEKKTAIIGIGEKIWLTKTCETCR